MWTIETKQKKGATWVELRKKFDQKPCYGNVLIIVSLGDGYFYKNEVPVPNPNNRRFERSSQDVNVRISLNGPIALTFIEWDDINKQIETAKQILHNI